MDRKQKFFIIFLGWFSWYLLLFTASMKANKTGVVFIRENREFAITVVILEVSTCSLIHYVCMDFSPPLIYKFYHLYITWWKSIYHTDTKLEVQYTCQYNIWGFHSYYIFVSLPKYFLWFTPFFLSGKFVSTDLHPRSIDP